MANITYPDKIVGSQYLNTEANQVKEVVNTNAARLTTVEGVSPTANQKAALAGTHGSPSGSNRYVTDGDPRLGGLSLPKAIFLPVEDVDALRAIDTTDATQYPNNWLIFVKTLGVYYLDRAATGSDDGNLVIEPAGGVGRWIKETRTGAGGGGGPAIADVYADTTELLAAQGAQETQAVYRVDDASGFGLTGYAYYEYLGTTVGDETDYKLLGAEEYLVPGGGGILRGVNVDDFGAVGDGITDDTAAIQAAISAAGQLGLIVYSAKKTYLIKETIQLSQSQTHLGWGATIKRADAVFATTTTVAGIGATTVDVDNVGELKIGDRVIIARGQSFGSTHNNGTTSSEITNIVGNTITYSPASTQSSPIGSKVVKVYALFNDGSSNTVYNRIGQQFIGLTFNGNRENNDITLSWVWNRTLDNLRQRSLIKNCFFFNIPAENVFISNNSQIIDNWALNCGGSLVHISNANQSERGRTIISGNIMRNMCLATNAISDHSEGAIVFSANGGSVLIHDNQLDGCSEMFCNYIGQNAETTIKNNIIKNTNGLFRTANVISEDPINNPLLGFEFSNNYCKNNDLAVMTFPASVQDNESIRKNAGYDSIKITDNTFINTKLFIREASALSVVDNIFLTTHDYVYSNTTVPNSIRLQNCTQFKIEGNDFYNRNDVFQAGLETAIEHINTGVQNNTILSGNEVKTDADTATEHYYYCRNSKIKNNTIVNYRNGIIDMLGTTGTTARRNRAWINFEISDNNIQLESGNNSVYAILSNPGATVKGNVVVGNKTDNTPAIYLLGINDGTGSDGNSGGTWGTRLNGVIAHDNRVYGCNRSIQAGNPFSSTRGANRLNIICHNNYITGSLQNNTGGSGTVANNFTLINETPPIITIRKNPEFY